MSTAIQPHPPYIPYFFLSAAGAIFACSMMNFFTAAFGMRQTRPLRKAPSAPNTVAAEQKARVAYDNILRLVDDPDVCEPIRFLRQREIVHYQRFGEALREVQDNLNYKNFYGYNPEFDKQK